MNRVAKITVVSALLLFLSACGTETKTECTEYNESTEECIEYNESTEECIEYKSKSSLPWWYFWSNSGRSVNNYYSSGNSTTKPKAPASSGSTVESKPSIDSGSTTKPKPKSSTVKPRSSSRSYSRPRTRVR
ncbi:MAG: hypothetical protein ACRCZZ_08890 [Phocaeicola sp.]